MSKPICLNMIVRNEGARIIRALDSVKDYISCLVILDTGSSDDTVEKIHAWSWDNKIPGVVAHGTFVNFSQARNQALAAARSYHDNLEAPWFDYILLMDADMELCVEIPALAFNGLRGDAYYMVQKAGGGSYSNVRLLSVASKAEYVGVTHEYLATEVAGTVAGAHFIDHADGANRPEKYERDVRLFEADLKRDPQNPRTWFYLANTYRDGGHLSKAVDAYRKRIALGGWDEEVWNAQVNLAECLEQQGLEDAYLKEALTAYQMRPRRAEPLHALAMHYRKSGANALAVMFAEKGLSIPKPNDLLFLQDWMYEWGFREEYSIAGFYLPETHERAFHITNGLALDPKVPDHVRTLARSNMVHYLRPLKDFAPSYAEQEINFTPSPGFTAMNPCVTLRPTGDLEVLLRTVNYRINEHGQYMIGPTGCWDAPIETENWLLQLGHDMRTRDYMKVRWDRPAPQYSMVLGLEDMRIFWHKGERQFVACCREQSATGTPEQIHGYLPQSYERNEAYVDNWKRISDPAVCEKNWAPIAAESPSLWMMYRLDKIQKAHEQEKIACDIAVDNISGGSPYIRFRNGFLSVVHEAVAHPTHGRRIYQHRFAWLDYACSRPRVSMPFVFREVQIEFAAGLAMSWHSGKIVVSFGERDEKAWLCTVSDSDVAAMLRLDR